MTKSGRYYPDPPMEKDKKTQNRTDQGPECAQGLHGDNSRRDCQSCAYRRWGSYYFSDHDLPAEGRNHSRALFVTAEVGRWKVPCVMIDDGSAINVCPLKILPKLGISMSELTGSDLVIRAYDDSKRNVIGSSRLWLRWGL
ncbi:hypothetical protein GH714_032746 [Hevea brasiliensis]|uniref:Uncharacterized protein n=1 Tax=Hevea brasiliensis TaxID=3981 RepID=A0A6A6LWU4_HEVBR|nr:hypothetical protein GH714_032746 [Hevea brasiliensis]